MHFTIRKIIFSLIPYRFIRFLKKYININYLLFGKAVKTTGDYIINTQGIRFDFFDPKDKLERRVAEGFRECINDYTRHKGLMRDYILKCNNCIIEPRYGWGIYFDSDKVIFDSIANNAWIESYHPDYFAYKAAKKSAIHYDTVVSIRMLKGGERNYWHFFHDILSQIGLARKNNLDNNPFVISQELSEQSYFKLALQKSNYLNSRNWIIQKPREYIKAGCIYFMQMSLNKKGWCNNVHELFELEDSDKLKDKRVFLTRNKTRIRFLSNNKIIEDIASNYNFEILDTDKLSLFEQIQIFSETKYLIGIHGAGLTNLLFRKNAPMKFLELMPEDYLQPHYFLLSRDLGHDYNCIIGSKTKYDTSFHLDPAEFEKSVQKLVD